VSDRAPKAVGAASRGDGDTGVGARRRAMQGAIAEDAARAAKIRRSAWLLGGLAVFFYLGYMAWIVIRAGGG